MDDVRFHRSRFAISLVIVCAVLTTIISVKLASAQGNKAVTVRIVDKAGYDEAIAAYKGKVVVVDCWATWCVPCRKAFPKTVEMGKAYAKKDVVVVSLSFDEPVKGEVPTSVKKFLTDNQATFENLVSSVEISGDGADVFAIPDGALPHFKIYGKDGKLFKAFESGEGKDIKHEDIEAAVKAAIAGKGK